MHVVIQTGDKMDESGADALEVGSSWAGIQRVATTPKPPEYFRGREGYLPDFLGAGATVALPTLSEKLFSDAAKLSDGTVELKYEHFSTVQSMSRRVPLYSACVIDGATAKSPPRPDTWSYDGRIAKQYQMLREAYGPEQNRRFSRGHMTRRQDPNWGSYETAVRANLDTFFATNACPQWQPFNDGLWGDLEDYILMNAKGDAKRVSVFTGPILRTEDVKRHSVQIPRDFWKVVAFISQVTGRLTAVAYVMGQGKYLDAGVAGDLEDFDMSQRPVSFVEQATGLRFLDLSGHDALDGADVSFIRPIRRIGDLRL